MPKKVNTRDFIDRAHVVHGDKYGYAFSVYQSAHTKVFIHCPEHGMFEQSPNSHLKGVRCPSCYGNKKHTNESFTQKAREVHGENTYCYSFVNYVNATTKVKIICPEHGEFEQSPSNHINFKQGCPICACVKKHTDDSFIEKAKLIHGDKYLYDLVVYMGAHSKVKIICPEHGEFEQEASSHLQGVGCPSCGGNKKHTSESFIEKAKQIHGNTYDYSKVLYKGNKIKIIILCNKHGEFKQTATSHLRGSGCPGCMSCGFDRTRSGFLYILRSDCGTKMKIGITNNPDQRQAQLSRATPFSFTRIELIEGPGELIANLEKELLAEYQPAGFTETFDGSTEWRLWSDSIRNKVKKDLRP